MTPSFSGEVKARIVEIRFAISGKISNVSKQIGDVVKKWDVVASLDRKILQTELDRQLADFEKVRADFEVYNQRNKEPQNDLEKYLKAEKQASLNASVKDVELAKARLDQAVLVSPVDGIVIDDSGIVPGIYVTPASGTIKIVDSSSYLFEFEVDQKNIHDFIKPRKAKIVIEGAKGISEATTLVVYSDGKKFIVRVPIANNDSLLLGMKGVCRV